MQPRVLPAMRTLALVTMVMPCLAAAQVIPDDEPASYLLRGIVRDFSRAHPDFNVNLATGDGHYAGNLNPVLDPGDRPAFTGAGYKVDDEWRDSLERYIAPGLYGVLGTCTGPAVGIACHGKIHINNQSEVKGYIQGQTLPGETPAVLATNAYLLYWVEVINSSLLHGNIFIGPWGDPNIGAPGSTVNVSPNSDFVGTIQNLSAPFSMPVLSVPPAVAALSNGGNRTFSGVTTLSSNLHCNRLTIDREDQVWVSGNLTILAEDYVRIVAKDTPTSGLFILPGSSLDIYVKGDMIVESPHVGDVGGDASKLRIYMLDSLAPMSRLAVLGNAPARLYAQVFYPNNGTMEVNLGAQFYGTYTGHNADFDQNSKIFVDMALATSLSRINDTPGAAGLASSGGITSAASFAQWYRDDLGENQSAPHSIELVRDGAGVYEYRDEDFHPIDGLLLGNEGEPHNNHFTYAIAADFTYKACAGQFVQFSGADDAWVYVDGNLVMDVGGVVPNAPQYLELDRLGLADGEVIRLNLFYAQRQPVSAIFRLRTNLVLAPIAIENTVTNSCD